MHVVTFQTTQWVVTQILPGTDGGIVVTESIHRISVVGVGKSNVFKPNIFINI